MNIEHFGMNRSMSMNLLDLAKISHGIGKTLEHRSGRFLIQSFSQKMSSIEIFIQMSLIQ